MIEQYAQSNKPNHHTPYPYAYADERKGAALMHQAMTKHDTNEPADLCRNDDVGQMSAWYVFSSMDLYPANPMDGKYVFSSPLMEEVSINFPNEKIFQVKSKNNIYINNVTLNGKNHMDSYITHNDIINGGELAFEISAKPSKKFGANKTFRP